MPSKKYIKENSIDGDKFKTTDFYLTAFLIIKGQSLENLKPMEDSDKKYFVFERSDRLRELVDAFYFAEDNDEVLQVSMREIIPVIRDLKDKLYNPVEA